MQCSRLLDEDSCTRALKDFLGALGTGARLREFLDQCRFLAGSSDRIPHPGFNLFLADTYQWFIPKPHATVPQFLRVYEAFADRPLGDVENVGNVILDLYPGSKWARKVFTGRKHNDMWMSPARSLLAASLWLGGEVEQANATCVTVRFGNGLLEVTNEGCYVNRWKSVHKAACEAFDQDAPDTTFRAVSYRNSILQAMQEAAASMGSKYIYACTVLATALTEEIIDRHWLKDRVMAEAPGSLVQSLAAAERSVTECTQILSEPFGHVMQNLYDSAVPNLMSAAQFRLRFGNPTHGNPNRKVAGATLGRWQKHINDAYSALSDAK